MATDIHNLPNEIPQNGKVVMKVNESNKQSIQNNVAAQVQQEIQHQYKQQHPQQQPDQGHLSPESIHQIVQGLQQAGGGTALPI